MSEEQKLMNDPKYKQFVAAIDKSLKSFEYSSEWADLISCLGKLNKVIQTYKQYSSVPRKLLIGKRLSQCLHPALPSGVHLKALESYDLIFLQIGSSRLAQDLFIYTTGLFPLLGQASIAVKSVLLDLYESHLLPLKKKIYPGLSGFLLALLPGIEEVSEFTERTTNILFTLCTSIEEEVFFSCLWDCILHSSQVRLSAIMVVIEFLGKQPGDKERVIGADVNLMVNALCAAFDDSNVLVQRITLDFAISFISFHTTTLPKTHLVKLLTHALGVLLRRDMSLNRRIYQWLLNISSEESSINRTNENTTTDNSEDDQVLFTSYFETYSKEPLVTALVILFHDVVESTPEKSWKVMHGASKYRSIHLKPFRILITLLDKPEIGSLVLDGVLLEVFRTLYKHAHIQMKLVEIKSHLSKDVTHIHDEVIKNANLLFNSFEPFYMWDYFSRILKKCSTSGTDENHSSLSLLVDTKPPNYEELFKLISYLLDIVSLDISSETQSEHWPKLLQHIIIEVIQDISTMNLDTVLEGILLISKLLSRLSPNITERLPTAGDIKFYSSVLSQKTPPLSPVHNYEIFQYSNTDPHADVIQDCIELSKTLFTKFVEKHIKKRNQKMLVMFDGHMQTDSPMVFEEDTFTKTAVTEDTIITGLSDTETAMKGFLTFCRYLVQLSCFPITSLKYKAPNKNNRSTTIPDWLQVLVACCCSTETFDVQAAAISALLDLIDVTLTVTSSSQQQNQQHAQASRIVPLISSQELSWLENTNLYSVLANSLWPRLLPNACQWHQSTVELILRLHNVTPQPSICEDVIKNALVHMNLGVREISHWRFSTLWHLSREFYKDEKNKSNVSVRTIDKCMLLMIDSLESPHAKVREVSEHWLSHSVLFGDIGRILECLLLILLDPKSSRISIHYKKNGKVVSHVSVQQIYDSLRLSRQVTKDETSATDDTGTSSRLGSFADHEDNCEEEDDEENLIEDYSNITYIPEGKDNDEQRTDVKDGVKASVRRVKSVSTHPLLLHKLLYTQCYDTQQCFYTLQRILLIFKADGRAFICAASTTSMNVCNTPHQSILRQLLIRHKRGLSGKDFYGSLADSHQLLIRASTAKYLEILLSVCLYFIRSEFHEDICTTPVDVEGNFAVQSASAQVLTQISYFLLEIAKDSGKGFSSYVNDLLFRSKIQRIVLHCLLSTVYAVTSDVTQLNEVGYYSMVKLPNLTGMTRRNSNTRPQIELQRCLLKLVESLIYLEAFVGTENVAAHTNEKKTKREKSNNISNIPPFEYVQFKPIVSQPMFISAVLTVLREEQWLHFHNDWIKLLVSCLTKFSTDMEKIIVPVVAQLCVNLKTVTKCYVESYGKREKDCSFQLSPDFMLVLLNGLTSFCYYCLTNSKTTASLVSGTYAGSRSKGVVDDPSSSMFSNLVNAFSVSPQVGQINENTSDIGSKALSNTRDGILAILPSILTAVSSVWKAWDVSKTYNSISMASKMALAIGQPKNVRLSILQLITPIAMNHTVLFLTSIADVWCAFRDVNYIKPSSALKSKEWLTLANKKFLPEPTADQIVLLEIVQAIKAMSLEMIIDTSRQVLRQVSTMKEKSANTPLDVNLLHFILVLLLNSLTEDIMQVKSPLISLLKDGLQLNLSPTCLFVLFGILNIYVQRIPLPDERRVRRELQDVAQKFVEALNGIAASSLEGSAWFRRSLQVVAQLDNSSELEESSTSDRSSLPDTFQPSPGGAKNSQYSVPALLIMAEFLTPLLDMLYLSEEKDKIASSLVYLLYNVTPYLKNHGTQNMAGYRACSALLAAISDYQYTLRSWRKDVYELFLDADFFQMDTISFGFWKTTIDRLITYDNTVFKDLMQRISLSQSAAINIFANREQEMEQRAQLLKRLSFAIFCGEFDQYHQYLPDIQERLAESIRQLQGPSLHEQVFLCFRVLLTRMSPNHLVSLWPPILTELVLVFVHMEHEIASSGKPKSKSKAHLLESFLGINGYFKDPNKWLRLYLAVCKLLDFLLVLPSSILPHYQVYRWAFSETPGVYCVTNQTRKEKPTHSSAPSANHKQNVINEHKSRIRRDSSKIKDEEVSKMALLNSPIVDQKKQALKEQQKHKQNEASKQENIMALFVPYITRILRLLQKQNLSEECWHAPLRVPGQLIVYNTKVQSVYDLLPFFLGVTGDLAARDVDVSKFRRFKMEDVEGLIEKDFIEATTTQMS